LTHRRWASHADGSRPIAAAGSNSGSRDTWPNGSGSEALR
jgi:hypothetical protein